MTSSFTILTLTPLLLLLFTSECQSQSTTAPSPDSSPVNLTGILTKGGQFNTFIRLLTTTQVASQIENQLNNSNQGITVFAPTDNAFNNLKAGTINSLTTEQQVQLVLYHVTPKYYTIQALQDVSNPVRTQASGQDGGVWGLNFTSLGSSQQVNVSTGVDETQINNDLWETFPLAVYEVDVVLLPDELFGTKSIALAPPPSVAAAGKSNSSSSGTATKGGSAAAEQSSGVEGNVGLGLGCVVGVWAVMLFGLPY
ncbi:hypothetical protein Droror1_Dr00003983 [Drosera rotundifolia]